MKHDEFKQSILLKVQDAQEAQEQKQFNAFGAEFNHYKPRLNMYRVQRVFGEYQDVFKLLGYDAPGPVDPSKPAYNYGGDYPTLNFKSITDPGFTSQIQVRPAIHSDALLLYSFSYRDGKELEQEKNMVDHARNEINLGDQYTFIPKARIEEGIQKYINGELLRFSPIKSSDVKMF